MLLHHLFNPTTCAHKILDGEAITGMRTAAASAVATKVKQIKMTQSNVFRPTQTTLLVRRILRDIYTVE